MLWTAARIAGVYFDFRDDVCHTYGLTGDARQYDLRRWEAQTPLLGIGRAILEHEKLSGDPVIRLLYLYIVLDYVTGLWEAKR